MHYTFTKIIYFNFVFTKLNCLGEERAFVVIIKMQLSGIRSNNTLLIENWCHGTNFKSKTRGNRKNCIAKRALLCVHTKSCKPF